MIQDGSLSGERFRPRFIDLFCGAGLLSHAFKSVGLRPALAIDLDKKAIQSYRNNVAKCAEVADVRAVRTDISADVIVAGPPCQGFSTLGRRDPQDVRNELGLSVLEWTSALNPKIVVIENVPGFLQSHWFDEISQGLKFQGYETQVFVLDAIDYGAAQKRGRAFTIGSRVGRVDMPTPRKSRPRTFKDVVLNRPIKADDPMHVWPTPSALAMERFQAIPERGGKRDLILNRPDLCPQSWHGLIGEATDVWGRIDADEPSNTVRCSFLNPSKGRYIHPFENRVLSLREGARLQGIPDSWVLAGEPTPIARQIGNGVPIPLGRAIAKEVMKALTREHMAETSYSAAA
ncbi:DNA cytosine methyltransferase [Celeribacter sp.]|uniref:DNA cytosine methyltransferase n=1 Tax=Celeribacter sp. TaxID=1890673 RepID=UPI003A9098FE